MQANINFYSANNNIEDYVDNKIPLWKKPVPQNAETIRRKKHLNHHATELTSRSSLHLNLSGNSLFSLDA